MPRFGRKVPRLVPLETPSIDRAPAPDVDAMHNQAHETEAFIKVAHDNAAAGGADDLAVPIATAIFLRHGTGFDGADRDRLRHSVEGSVRLGLGFAEIETYAGMGSPGMSDVRIWNAIIMAGDDFPEHLAPLLSFAVRTGYYVGRNGPDSLRTVMGGSS